ncbi:hypothetical protein ACF3M1_06985 [Luteimonas sp. WGS1318]|uniref:hypothetical protein n=1 Tax=Luteimonas sp. WGS1318 TaxID=3366815 RepID=UPI00372D7E90
METENACFGGKDHIAPWRDRDASASIAARRAHDAVAIHLDDDLHVFDTNLLPSA